MKHIEEMYEERHKLLKTYIASGIQSSVFLKLIEPMKYMSEEEKEEFAKALRLKLEKLESTPRSWMYGAEDNKCRTSKFRHRH